VAVLAEAKPHTETSLVFTITQTWKHREKGQLPTELSSQPYKLTLNFTEAKPLNKILGDEINHLFDLLAILKTEKKKGFLRKNAQTTMQIEKVVNGEKFSLCRVSRFSLNLLGKESERTLAKILGLAFADLFGYVKRENKKADFLSILNKGGKMGESEFTFTQDFYTMLKTNGIELAEKMAQVKPIEFAKN